MRKNFTPEQMLHTVRQVEGGMAVAKYVARCTDTRKARVTQYELDQLASIRVVFREKNMGVVFLFTELRCEPHVGLGTELNSGNVSACLRK